MRIIRRRVLCLMAAMTMTACAAGAEEHMGEAEGYGGTLKVRVTMDGGRLAGVTVTEHHETEGVGTRAIDEMPAAMVAAGTWQVDGVSGATVTSNALKAAVQDAMGENSAVSPAGESAAPQDSPGLSGPAQNALSGVGMCATGRLGPGKDTEGNQVYSFNVVFAHGLFDEEGRVLALGVDQLEVSSPNLEGDTASRFTGWPEEGGGTLMEEISAWRSKSALGAAYRLNSGTWREEMDAYQRLFTGKTVDEIEAWYDKYCSEETGRPLREEIDSEDEQAKYDALTQEEQRMLADATTMATMSLRDSHGDILTAIRRAWEDAQTVRTPR